MSHPGIFQSSYPAERMRGAKLVEDFRDALTVARNGWTKASAPTFDDGGTFDGVDDSLTSGDSILNCNGVSFWVTLGSADEEILTLSATHSISVAAGVVTATGWTAPTIWVNGVATTAIGLGRSFVTIVTATSFTANTVIVGKIAAAFGAFKIERLAIWATSTVLTLAEHTAYYNDSMFNWRNRATVDLPFGTAQYAPIATPTNVLVDGNCEAAGVGDWTASDATLTKEVVAPYAGTRWLKVLVVPAEPTTCARAIQNVLTVGKQYIVIAHVHGDGTGVFPRIYHNGTTILVSGTTDTAWQAVSDIFTAVATDISFGTRVMMPVGTEFVGFDSIYVYEYTGVVSQTLDRSGHGNHATLGDGYGVGSPTQGRGYMTFDGVDDYLSGIADPAGSYTVFGYKDTGTGWTFFSNNDLTEWTPIMTSGGFTGKLGHLMVVPEVLNATQLLDAAWQLRQYGSEI